MRFGKTIIILTLAAIGSFACDRTPQTPPAGEPTAAPPAPHPVAVDSREAPASRPATQPSVILLIDGEQKEFPGPRLVVDDRNGKTIALLMSDDPPQAINDDYAGNSYYLEMEFDDLLPTVRGQEWIYESPDSEKQDTPNGIFLHGNHQQLQPFQVKVQFQQVDGGDVAWISGTFRAYIESDRPPMPRVVSVTGRLPVKLP